MNIKIRRVRRSKTGAAKTRKRGHTTPRKDDNQTPEVWGG
jgi:hypothetical protein